MKDNSRDKQSQEVSMTGMSLILENGRTKSTRPFNNVHITWQAEAFHFFPRPNKMLQMYYVFVFLDIFHSDNAYASFTDD